MAGRPQRARMPALFIVVHAEHDLIQSLGGTYAAYRARVPALIPRPSLRHPPLGSCRSEENDRKQAT